MPDVCLQMRPSGKLREYAKLFGFAERCCFDGVEVCCPPMNLDYERLHLLSLEHDQPIRSVIMPGPLSPAGLLMNGKSYAYEQLDPDLLVVEVPRIAMLNWPAFRLFKNSVLLFRQTYGKEKVTVENSSPTQFQHPVLDLKGIRDFAYEHDIFINFDLSNCAASGMDILLSCDMLIPRIRNVHFSDYGGQALQGHLLPGRGLLPLGMLLSRLAEYRYDGLITLEVDQGISDTEGEDPVVLYSEIVGFIKSYFSRRPRPQPSAVSSA